MSLYAITMCVVMYIIIDTCVNELLIGNITSVSNTSEIMYNYFLIPREFSPTIIVIHTMYTYIIIFLT